MFQCSLCDTSYQRKCHLERHLVTHTRKPSSGCPFCNKTFLKPEVARRHSKVCAKKHRQPSPPAAKPGRKRQSCDNCSTAKRACDKSLPCSRCSRLGQRCIFSSQRELTLLASSSTEVSLKPHIGQRSGLADDDSQFSFLRHFTDPYVNKDRLAIGTTAESSTRRNLETLYSHLEHALIPTHPMETYFGDFSSTDLFYQSSLPTDEFMVADCLSHGPFSSNLSRQLNDIMMELVETSKSLIKDQQQPLDVTGLASLFTVTNVSTFISTFFHSLYWHLPVVHFPTFDPGNVSNPLLLAIFLSGAIYATPLGGAALPSRLLDVAEEYIFRRIISLSMVDTPLTEDLARFSPTVQLIQSALITEMLQFGQEELQTRRRIRIIRHPCLVSIMRSLGFFHLKRTMAPKVCDDRAWRRMVAEEVCIRLACWTFLADGFLTVCFKNCPTISSFEMDCHLPWRTELWEAENAEPFSRIATLHGEEASLPPVREVVQSLLDSSNASVTFPWSLSLCVEHLLILIYAISSLAFQARVGFFGSISLKQIKFAITNWKQIWDSLSDPLRNQQLLPMGYPKHAKELWLLLSATLDAASKSESNILYLDNGATDDLGDLNQFIQWCSRST